LKTDKLGLMLGPLVLALALILPAPDGMKPAAMKTAGVVLLMVIWWITEAIPIPATSLIPLAAYPLLGIMDTAKTAVNYADQNIFLFMGGFIIALSMEKWNLHKRIALKTIQLMGTGMRTLVLGFMIASAVLSMWMSNTATAMMMLPVALAVLSKFEDSQGSSNLGVALMLGIAYSASVGGMGTLIGTPPNIVLAGQVKDGIGFVQWMQLGLPMVAVFVPIIWFYLVRLAAPLPRHSQPVDLKDEIAKLGRMSLGEWIALVVFLLTALCWILRRPVIAKILPMVTDASIAMTFAVLLFVIPVSWKQKEFAMDWEQMKRLPWGVLLLFGGGFAIASGMDESGLSAWLSGKLSVFEGLPTFLLVLIICTFMALLTELTSNTAAVTTMLPVLAATAKGMGINPLVLMVPATIASSCAFMLPVATPPNAIVFSSGKVSLKKMFKTGIWMNLIGILLTTLVVCTLGRAILG
jgi:sodium-dependent dicarboxylate transporter 2/3/5